jgi:hypothetical protein
MMSSWQHTVATSRYHFDRTRQDPRWDTVTGLGWIDPEAWCDDLGEIIEHSQPATWETRGYKEKDRAIPSDDLIAEQNDLARIGADPDMVISNIGWELPRSLRDITANFALANEMNRLHVQWPGQVWTRHIDKLDKFCPEDPSRVMRIMIQLTDWQPGQFWEFGNYQYRGWRAGDVTTFDWRNVPHCTANAGHHPRVTLQLTGARTAGTEKYLDLIKNLG